MVATAIATVATVCATLAIIVASVLLATVSLVSAVAIVVTECHRQVRKKDKKQHEKKTKCEPQFFDSAISLRSLRASDWIAQKPAEGGPGSARLDPDPQKRTVVLSRPIQSKLFSHNCLPGYRTQKGLIGSDHDDSHVAQGEDIAASLERLSLSDSRMI